MTTTTRSTPPKRWRMPDRGFGSIRRSDVAKLRRARITIRRARRVDRLVLPPALDPRNDCPDCGGTYQRQAMGPRGATLMIACKRCAPNDAPGG